MKLVDLMDTMHHEEEIKKDKLVSFGVAIVRKNEGEWEICLGHPSGNDRPGYGFPKGGKSDDDDENEVESAYREGKEETGLNFKIKPSYRFEQTNSTKDVIIFLATLLDNEGLRDSVAIDHDWECDIVKFFPFSRLPPIFDNQEKIMDTIRKLNLDEIIGGNK